MTDQRATTSVEELSDHDWLQIEQAAAGCISGELKEWPDLTEAIRKAFGDSDERMSADGYVSDARMLCLGLVFGRGIGQREGASVPQAKHPSRSQQRLEAIQRGEEPPTFSGGSLVPDQPSEKDIDALANDIRKADGGHSLGAGDLAERLCAMGWLKAVAPLAALRTELERLRSAFIKQQNEIQQTLGLALDYPKFADDQKNFPGATGDSVCVGDHVAESLSVEAASKITALRNELEAAKRTQPGLTQEETERLYWQQRAKAYAAALREIRDAEKQLLVPSGFLEHSRDFVKRLKQIAAAALKEEKHNGN